VTRDDDFTHIPELGPARDKLDQSIIPTLQNPPGVSGAAKAQPASPISEGGSHRKGSESRSILWLLLLLLMAIMGAGGYWGLGQIQRLQQQLIDSNKRLASLEGLISATDESANKSGAALQAQLKRFMLNGEKRLKHVDSELAKLWTVAYQRNKPKISEIDQTVATLDKQSTAFAEQLTQTQTALTKAAAEAQQFNQLQQALQTRLGTLEKEVKARLTDLGGRLQLRDQANQELDSIQDTQLQQLEKRLKALQSNPAVPEALTLAVKDHEQAIAAINSFRKQVNTELQRLGSQLDQLQRNANSATPAALPAPKTQ